MIIQLYEDKFALRSFQEIVWLLLSSCSQKYAVTIGSLRCVLSSRCAQFVNGSYLFFCLIMGFVGEHNKIWIYCCITIRKDFKFKTQVLHYQRP